MSAPPDPAARPTPISSVLVEQAAERLRGHVQTTPLKHSVSLSELCRGEVYLKLENQQITGSFKARGACNRLLCLTNEERQRGVIAASAGNHALGLAYFGKQLGISVHVVMPESAPIVKISRCEALNAKVTLYGEHFADAQAFALELAQKEGGTFVHGFNDELIIAGQGTAALELLDQHAGFDLVVVPTGGGGLLAGVGTALAKHSPSTRLIGVEAERAPTVTASMEHSRPTRITPVPSLADGLSVAEAGAIPFGVIHTLAPQMETVEETAILRAMVQLMEAEKQVVEGAGAVGVALVRERPELFAGKTSCVLLTGGNVDLNIVARIIERGLASANRLLRVRLPLDDRPGALEGLIGVLSDAGANILEIAHDRHFAPADVRKVNVTVVMETRDKKHIQAIRDALKQAGWGSHSVAP